MTDPELFLGATMSLRKSNRLKYCHLDVEGGSSAPSPERATGLFEYSVPK